MFANQSSVSQRVSIFVCTKFNALARAEDSPRSFFKPHQEVEEMREIKRFLVQIRPEMIHDDGFGRGKYLV